MIIASAFVLGAAALAFAARRPVDYGHDDGRPHFSWKKLNAARVSREAMRLGALPFYGSGRIQPLGFDSLARPEKGNARGSHGRAVQNALRRV